MTSEEAIGIVRCAIGEVEWNYPMDYSVAFEVAIEALEKQIPKKPHKNYRRLNVKWCECGCYLGELKNEQNYCKKCGQALDWSDCPTEKGR